MGLEEGQAKAVKFFTKACDKEDWRSCSALGGMYEAGGQGITQDWAKAMEFYRRGCGVFPFGSGMGCYGMATLYQNGRGVAKDEAKAAKLFEKACKMRYKPGCAASMKTP